MEIIFYLATGVGLMGVLVIIWGALVTIVEFCTLECKRFLKKNICRERSLLRYHLSSYLMLGLEFMIGADIIRTIIRPSLSELAILAGLVAIRTVVSYSLSKEIKGISA